jgi:hypothetical protein
MVKRKVVVERRQSPPLIERWGGWGTLLTLASVIFAAGGGWKTLADHGEKINAIQQQLDKLWDTVKVADCSQGGVG